MAYIAWNLNNTVQLDRIGCIRSTASFGGWPSGGKVVSKEFVKK